MSRPNLDKIVSDLQRRLADDECIVVVFIGTRYGGFVIDHEPLIYGGSPEARERALKQWRKRNSAEKAFLAAVIEEMAREIGTAWSKRPPAEREEEIARRMHARRPSR